MKKRITGSSIQTFAISACGSLTITIDAVPVKDLCLCLVMLRDDLIQAFSIAAPDAKHTEFAFSLRKPSGIRSLWQPVPKGFAVELCMPDAECLLGFLLGHYRDGYSSVDHVDLETEESTYITVRAPTFLNPVPYKCIRQPG